MQTDTRHKLLKLLVFWVLFLILHFSYSWFPNPIVAVFSGTNECIMQHAKIGFIAYSIASLIEYLLWKRKQPGRRSSFNARVLTALFFPWVMFIIWYIAPAFYGQPMPTVAAEIIYANIALLAVGGTLAWAETDLEKIVLSPWKERLLWFLWVLSLVEMVIFTFRIPWADFFRG
jgi:hypothetical protein